MATEKIIFILLHLHLLMASTTSSTPADSSRDNMIADIADGGATVAGGDASTKNILARGCDPRMAARAKKMLPPMLGDAAIVSVTDDDDFLEKLTSGEQWDVVFFAPGACRFNAAKQPIPGGRVATRGWTLENYRALVRQNLGDDVPIIETTEEREIVPLLRAALGLDGEGGEL